MHIYGQHVKHTHTIQSHAERSVNAEGQKHTENVVSEQLQIALSKFAMMNNLLITLVMQQLLETRIQHLFVCSAERERSESGERERANMILVDC